MSAQTPVEGVSFVCLFRGPSIETAQLVGTSTDTSLVRTVAAELLEDEYEKEETPDPVRRALNRGKRQALRVISRETEDASNG